MRLSPVSQQGWEFSKAIALSQRVTALGRSNEFGIPAKAVAVSRKHCDVKLASNGNCVELLPLKTVWIQRHGEVAKPCRPKGQSILVDSPPMHSQLLVNSSHKALLH